jgi:hypothetical protein
MLTFIMEQAQYLKIRNMVTITNGFTKCEVHVIQTAYTTFVVI